MNTAIAAAIITAIVGPTLTLLLTRYLDSRAWRRISGGRRVLVGDWRGVMNQEFDTLGPVEAPIHISFTSGRRRVRGTAHYDIPGQSPAKLTFRGGFVYEHLIQLEYVSEGTWQRGTFIGQLDSAGRKLEGTFAGFGLESNRPVHGTVKLTKV